MSGQEQRIAPIALDQVADEHMERFGGRDNPRNQLNFFKVLIQHPALLANYEPLAMQLGRTPTIPLRDKEILVLRTLTLCGETYEMAHHRMIARTAGLSDEEFEAARQGSGALGPFELALTGAAEDLVRGHRISDSNWKVLAERYTASQLIELVFMVGNYTLLSMIDNSLGIYPEDQIEKTWKPTDKS